MDLLDQIESETLRNIYRYWLGKCRGETLPGLQDIKPTEIPKLLRNVYLIDVLEDDRNFRYRLVGTRIVDDMSIESTGQLVSEFLEEHESLEVMEHYFQIVTTRRPCISSDTMAHYGRDHVLYERLLCPLASDGMKVDTIFGGLYFESLRRND